MRLHWQDVRGLDWCQSGDSLHKRMHSSSLLLVSSLTPVSSRCLLVIGQFIGSRCLKEKLWSIYVFLDLVSWHHHNSCSLRTCTPARSRPCASLTAPSLLLCRPSTPLGTNLLGARTKRFAATQSGAATLVQHHSTKPACMRTCSASKRCTETTGEKRADLSQPPMPQGDSTLHGTLRVIRPHPS
eukprot:SAG11_NODE_3384_length_2482_cov_5.328997_2_plen_185_part_00